MAGGAAVCRLPDRIGRQGGRQSRAGVASTAAFREHFIDPAQRAQLDGALASARAQRGAANDSMAQAEQQHTVAAATAPVRNQASLTGWRPPRHQRSGRIRSCIARTRSSTLRAAERRALAAVQAQQQALLDASQAQERASARERELRLAAQGRQRVRAAQRSQEMRVFLYRLALTLPLLVIAGWLFARTAQEASYWPFVWGFIFFALFAFFVELVPYLPSYGGYVRYIVGIIITVFVGRYAITLAASLSGPPEAGRSPAGSRAPRNHELRQRHGPPGQKRLPRLRAQRRR